MSDKINEWRFRVRVVGCVRPGCVDVLIDRGSPIPICLPLEIVPIEFRFPNTEFIVIYDRKLGYKAVEPLS